MKNDISKIDYTEQYRLLTREPVKIVSYPLPRKPEVEPYKPTATAKGINAGVNHNISNSWQCI